MVGSEEMTEKIDDEMALRIGRLILRVIKPIVFSIEAIMKEPDSLKYNYKLVCGFMGEPRDEERLKKFKDAWEAKDDTWLFTLPKEEKKK
jgi:hypothetical protein